MTRDWKVGDLAVVTTKNGSEYLAVYEYATGIDYFWKALNGRPNNALVNPDVSARPLVVIDPEDREQVERLTTEIQWLHSDQQIERVQDALRSLIEPPRPEEPTGLGAVVFAVCQCEPERKRFVRDDTGSEFAEDPWKSHCGHHVWADLDVRDIDDLLAEGVRP